MTTRFYSAAAAGAAAVVVVLLLLAGCMAEDPAGLYPSQPAATTVVMDFYNKPLPEIPVPNDVATVYDATAATGRRINASLLAATGFERRVRALMDRLDGWGTFQPISIPFSGPLDVGSILRGHRDADYDPGDDVIYLINVDRDSADFGRLERLDVGNGNYPVVLEDRDKYWDNDPRAFAINLLFEEADEDENGNGVLDPGEDTDGDGVLDRPNYLPGKAPARDDLVGRADALMTFYERETNTLIVRPMTPLRERTTYAVVVTRRLKDAQGSPVGSPYPYINHASQTEALAPLADVLPTGLGLSDVAFAFTFTTQSVTSEMMAVREGLYGRGVQAHLGTQFPAELSRLLEVRDRTFFKTMNNPHVLPVEHLKPVLGQVAGFLLSGIEDTFAYDLMLESTRYIDFFMAGSIKSPQLFPRRVDDGDPTSKLLGYNDQVWPASLDRIVATARAEEIPFWISVPRKEVSARGKGKPAPVVIFGHGLAGNRVTTLALAGLFAQHGLAVLSFDFPSHGMGLGKVEVAAIKAVAEPYGLSPFLGAMLEDRALDQNGDGRPDSGADFMTAYAFHTRDMMRQSTLDTMQMIRLLRSFDGKRRSKFDVDGDGARELAGDFDGDGEVDVGGSAEVLMAGGSLGGILTLMVSGLEPEITTAVALAGGAGLGDIGVRTRHGAVLETLVLRLLSPLYVGTLDAKSGRMKLSTIVTDLDDPSRHEIDTVDGVKIGDTVVVENLGNGERGCGHVSQAGKLRLAVESDAGDRTRILFYRGSLALGEQCAPAGAAPYATVDEFKVKSYFQDQTVETGSDLRALAEGMGLPRNSPRLRRFLYFAMMALDAGDPVSYVRHITRDPLVYPDGSQTGASLLSVATIGDMVVPTSTAITAGRAAGLIDYTRPDPRYGVPQNQVLLDSYVAEAVHKIPRYTHPQTGKGVHKDVDDFSDGKDTWGDDIPRLSPPLRCGLDRRDRRGGTSAALFVYAKPEGTHVFEEPGKHIDAVRESCRKKCTKSGGDDPCGCDTLLVFDPALFVVNMAARYLGEQGRRVRMEACNATNSCGDMPKPPPERDPNTLP